MKRTTQLMILTLCLSTLALGQINLGKIRDKVKKSKSEGASTSKTSTSTKSKARSGSGNVSSDAVMLDETLLSRRSMNFGYTNGRLRLINLRAMNLPKSIDKTHDKFVVTYRSADGKRLAAFRAYAQAPVTKRSWLLGNFLGVDSASNDFLFNKEGNYYLDFSVNGQSFDRFDFSIKKHTNPEGKTTFLINGGWENLAYIKYDPKLRRPTVIFRVFLRDLKEGSGVRPKGTGSYMARVIRVKDKKVIGIDNPKGATIGLHRYWDSPLLSFMHATKPERMTAEHLFAVDGKYYVDFVYNGKPYGKYYFEIKNGSFVGADKYKGEKIGTDGTVTWMERQR